MESNEARDLFSEAYEGDLEEARRAGFEAALEADQELKAEYDDFVETLQMVSDLGKADDGLPPPDLLRGVQERLRNRSKGRYYRDRFSERASLNWMLSVMLAVTVLFLIGAGWYVTQQMAIEEAPAASDDTAPDDTASDDTASDDTAPDDTAPDDTASDDTAPESAPDAPGDPAP